MIKVSGVPLSLEKLKAFFSWFYHQPFVIFSVLNPFRVLRKPRVWLGVYSFLFVMYAYWGWIRSGVLTTVIGVLAGGIRSDFNAVLWIPGFVIILLWQLWSSQEFLRWAKKGE